MARTSRRALVILGALVLVTTARPLSAAGGFVVLVNRNNPATTLSRSELKRVVTGGTKQWDDGAVVQLGIIPAEVPETTFLASLFDLTPRELLARLQEQIFKGELRRPVVLRSSSDCAAFARATPGAVCIALATEAVPAEVRVLTIH